MVLLLLINSLFALTYIIVENALHFVTPLVLLTYRMLFSGVLLVSFQYYTNKKSLYIHKTDLIFILITCLFHMYINFLSETYAFQKLSSIMVSIFYLISPVISAIIDYLITNNKLTKEQIITIIIGTILSLCMIFLNTTDNFSFNNTIYPYCLLLISIITSTIAWYHISFLLKKGYSLVTINGYASSLSGVIFLFMTLFNNEFIAISDANSFNYVLLPAIALAIISNIICYNLYSKLLKLYSITTILFAELLCPCFTAYYQWFLFNIIPKVNHFVFFILFIACIIVFNYYDKKI